MRRRFRGTLRAIGLLLGLALIAAAVGGYILVQQGYRFPLISDEPLRIAAEFSDAQAVVAGQGQLVRVAGVRVGEIGGVELRNGRALVALEIDDERRGLVRTDATAILRPRTGLKDMFVELDPGDPRAPPAREGFTIPVGATRPDVDLDEILSALDLDTREHLQLLVGGLDQGLDANGERLSGLLERLGPTTRDLRRVTRASASRDRELRRAVSGLAQLGTELAQAPQELSGLVADSSRVFGALGAERRGLDAALVELPGALRATSAALPPLQATAEAVPGAVDVLVPTLRALHDGEDDFSRLGLRATPIVRDAVRPLTRDLRPVLRELRPASRRLARATPDLTASVGVVNRLFNMLAFNPRGREGPEVVGREEGYLFWLAWLTHNSTSLFSTADANGPFRRVLLSFSCSGLTNSLAARPELEFLANLTPLLAGPGICPKG